MKKDNIKFGKFSFVGSIEEFKYYIKSKDGEYIQTAEDKRTGTKLDRR